MFRTDLEMPSRLWYEEMNRIRHQIQKRWTQAQRAYRRRVAQCRQQELVRLLRSIPDARMTHSSNQLPTSEQQNANPTRKPARASRSQPDACDARPRRPTTCQEEKFNSSRRRNTSGCR